MTCQTDTRLFPCPQCGVPTAFRFGMGHYYPRRCPCCAAEAKRVKDRKAAAKQRAKKGIAVVKDTAMSCTACGEVFTRKSLKTVRCRPCHKRRSLDRQYAGIRRRRHSDPGYALNLNMSYGIRASLSGGKAGRPWESIVGYTVEDLMRHLERQFLPGMTWANRHLWHVDHRRPLASFSFTGAEDPAFMDAWGLTNLQPLWARDNRVKSASRIYLL